MDERYLELASNTEEQERIEGVTAIRAKLAPQTHPDFDGKHCVECETDLPYQRLQTGRVRCTDCQAALEHQQKRRAA